MEYTNVLKDFFESKANPELAEPMKKYMRNQFEFLGIKFPQRRELAKSFFKQYGYPEKGELEKVISFLWDLPQREFQFLAIELLEKFIKKFEKNDIDLLEKLIISKSWWDTVDTIAVRLVGEYFKKFPEQIIPYTNRWVNSENIWLKRTAILFQLKCKKNTNTELLSEHIKKCSNTNEFFLNKAIGWSLREYLKTDEKWVKDFVDNNKLSDLSKREALKNIN